MKLCHFLSPRCAALAAAATWVLLRAARMAVRRHPPPALRGGRRPAVFLTGCDTGIGRAAVDALLDAGFVVFAGVLSPASLPTLPPVPSCRGLLCNVLNEDDFVQAAATIEADSEVYLYGIVLNAGVADAEGPAELLADDRMRRTFDINFFSHYRALRVFLPTLRRNRGRVIQVASINAFSTWAAHSIYAASKHSVAALARTLQIELRQFGVSVSRIEPGGIATPIWSSGLESSVRGWRDMEDANPEVARQYGRFDAEAARVLMEESIGRLSQPSVVAKSIADSLTSRFPRDRYLVGRAAGFLYTLHWLLPETLFDLFMATVVKRPVLPEPETQ